MNIFDIPIITYHKVSSQKEFGLTTISPDTFKKQMQLLSDQGYQTITYKQFNAENILPQKPIIVSFDDTYKNVYECAFPIMKDFNFKGVLFVISDFIGKKNDWEAYSVQRKYFHANNDEIQEMHEYGFEIGSHCKTHRFLPHLSDGDIQSELEKSKEIIENIFDTNIITCCYPYGGYNKKVNAIAQTVGYKYAMGNIKLQNNQGYKQLCLQRRSIYSIDSLSAFYKKVDSPKKINFNYLKEWSIQKAAFAGILKKKYFKFNV